MIHWRVLFFFVAMLFAAFSFAAAPSSAASPSVAIPPSGAIPPVTTRSEQGYEQITIEQEAAAFFGEASEGLARSLAEAFKAQGKPNAYIKGQESGLAITFGVRYGDGIMKAYGRDDEQRIFWQGPSIGFDQGLNCSKVFILVYNLPSTEAIFRGFPGVETGLYYYAGMSATYLESNNIILIPIRLGMGLRTSLNIGYLRFSRAPSWSPF
ncbi:DUF1134 domain-containing protein [Gammaproteobacteria bacterium]